MAYVMDSCERRFLNAVSPVRNGWHLMSAKGEPGTGSEDIGAKTDNEKATVAACAAVPSKAMKAVLPTYTDHVEDRRC